MKNFLESNQGKFAVLLAILLLAFGFRMYGINWDQNQHLHPDERFLTMVTQNVSWPENLGEYLDPDISPLSPYNTGYDFFVYGTLPLKIVKLASENLTFDTFDYNNITLVGRFVSLMFDLGVVFLVFKIGQKVFNDTVGLTASFVYAASVLPIQLSHFYAVDTFLVFFLTLSFFLLTKLLSNDRVLQTSIFMGISFGLALASKVTALFIVPFICFGYLYLILSVNSRKKTLTGIFLFSLFGYISFRIADPRVFSSGNFFDFTINNRFISNLEQLKSFNNSDSLFPPAIQWINTKPLLFPLKNMFLWGLGIPLGVLAITGVLFSIWNQLGIAKSLFNYKLEIIKHVTVKQLSHMIILLWVLLIFFYQGIQFTKALRYFYPIYPFLAILTANFLYNLTKKTPLLLATCCLLLLIWPLSFSSIYSKQHSRVTASKWIYKNIPKDSTISCEYWDDCLPLPQGKNNAQLFYKTEELHLYDMEGKLKWDTINEQLEDIDYLILSSNRLSGSITSVPEIYPQTSMFYKSLLANELQFTKVAEFTSRPTIPLLNIPVYDDSADESYTVYDHPKVVIFRKNSSIKQ